MLIRDFNILVIFLFASFFAIQTQAQIVSGKIVDEQNIPVPYATIFVSETKEGTISNSEGNYHIQLLHGVYHFTIRSLGYVQVIKEVNNTSSDSLILNITLKKQAFEIKEVLVFPGKEDPAWFIMRKAITKAPYYRQKIKHYEADLYIKANFAFTSIPRVYQNKIEIEGRKLKELIKENVTYVIESQNKITYNYPNKYDQKVISRKTSLVGIDEPPVMELMAASFYDERPNNLISPLSSLAIKHYNFRYEGFISVGDYDVFKIKVTPNRKSDELVDGYIYIVDKLWCIYNLDFKGRFEFFEYRIKQQFENLGNNNWLPVSDNIDGSISMLGLKGQVYYGVALKYRVVEENNFGDIQPQETVKPAASNVRQPGEKEKKLRNEAAALNAKEELTNREVAKASRINRKILKEQYKDTVLNDVFRTNYQVEELKDTLANDYEFWDTMRAIPLSPAEMESYAMNDSLMRMKLNDTDSLANIKPAKVKKLHSKILTGDWDLAKDSVLRLSYDGLFSFKNFDFNAVDGYKYRQKFELSFKLDSGKQLLINPEIGYAINRNAAFGSVTTTFKDIFWEKGTVGLGFGKESRDFKTSPPGILPILNAASSWFFAENYMKLYETTFFKLNISQRINQKLTLSTTFDYNLFSPLENNAAYLLSSTKDFSSNLPPGFTNDSPEIIAQKSFMYTVGANYYKRQRKPWLEESPFIFIKDFYNINIQFNQGLKNVFSSVSNFSQIDISYHQQANISPSAGIDFQVNAGHFFNTGQMHFSQFKHFKTNEIPVMLNFFTSTFQLMNDYEPSTNKSYLNIGSELRTEYVLLRYLSFINTNTWSESLHLNYVTTPTLNNYWEAGYSLNSLLFVGNVGVFAGFKGTEFESFMIKITISGY
ncbi:MAG TPA: DUF5686 and carboxypeptidase regulatory-like domain-containing protein [Draconibacterium sp.]|nr:DUF5686 and carboxypeptidase regulatory-like domain-containing protein [Draconibacterium sp.]